MAIRFSCGSCGRKFVTKEEHAGRRSNCPACGQEIVVPDAFPFDSAVRDSSEPPPVPDQPPIALASSKQGRQIAVKAASVVAVIVAAGIVAEGYARLRMGHRATPASAKQFDAPPAALAPPPPPPAPPKPQVDYTRWTPVGGFKWNYPDATCVAFAPNGTTIAVGGGSSRPDPLPQGGYGEGIETGVVQFWDLASGEAQGQFLEPRDRIENLVFLPDGTTLAVGDRRRIRLINSKTLSTKYIINASGLSFIAVNRRRGIIADSVSGFFWDAKNGNPLRCFVERSMDNGTFSEDGRYLFASGVIWDCKSETRVGEIQAARAAFSHDNRFIGAINGVWSIEDRTSLWMDGDDRWAGHDRVTGVVFSPDDKYLICSSLNGSIEVRESWSGRLAARFRALGTVLAMALSPSGEYMVTVGESGDATEPPIKVWRVISKPVP